MALRAFHVEKMSEEAYRRQQIIKKKKERKRESLLYYPSLLKALVHCAKGHWNTLVGLTFVMRLVDCQDTRTKVLPRSWWATPVAPTSQAGGTGG